MGCSWCSLWLSHDSVHRLNCPTKPTPLHPSCGQASRSGPMLAGGVVSLLHKVIILFFVALLIGISYFFCVFLNCLTHEYSLSHFKCFSHCSHRFCSFFPNPNFISSSRFFGLPFPKSDFLVRSILFDKNIFIAFHDLLPLFPPIYFCLLSYLLLNSGVSDS